MQPKNKRLSVILGIVGGILLIPFIAMQFTDEVNWSPFDFLVMGGLLLGTGLSCELALRKIRKSMHRLIACLALLTILFLVWVELAVGVFGTPFAGS